MSKTFILIFLVFKLLTTVYGQAPSASSMVSPMHIPPYLSGSFGELRGGHFHSGIDIKTKGRVGIPVHAVADGYISRIKISAGGYGHALYIAHPNGTTSVYAHLSKFALPVANWVEKEQYRQKSFAINLFPTAHQFPIKKGQLIGKSGNTGSSMGPHLHFEIRKTASQKPVNPMFYNIHVKDDIAPRFSTLAIYPLEKSAQINNSHQILYLPTKNNGTPRKFHISTADTISISGAASFGVEVYDYLNGTHNRCGLRSLTVKVDNQNIFRYIIDGFSFSESRYINSLIDYPAKIKQKKQIQRTYIQPNNKLSIYDHHINRGIFQFIENKTYNLQIEAEDFAGNTSLLKFVVKGSASATQTPSNPLSKNEATFNYTKKINTFSNNQIAITVPGAALYDTISFRFTAKPANNPDFQSPIYQLHRETTPLHMPFSASIKIPDTIAPEIQDKLLALHINKTDEDAYIGEIENNKFHFKSREFGSYVLAIDTIPPKITQLFNPEEINTSIAFKISDERSGINTYEGYIDGKWALFEYDAKNDKITCQLKSDRIIKNQEHELELIVIDNTNNMASFQGTFFW